MARPKKEGLEYFPTDVDIFDDPKLLFVTNKFGDYGDLIAVKLLTWIYRNGYFLEWNDEMLLLFSARAFKSIDQDLVKNVVDELIKRDFFSRQIFEAEGVLTSRGIQRRWLHIQRGMKRKTEILKSLCLITEEETHSKTEETISIEEETPLTTEFSTQKEKKGNEKKGNEKKGNESGDTFLLSHFPKIKSLYAKFTKIQDPNSVVHLTPVAEFFSKVPEHLTENDISEAITETFKSLDKTKGVRVDILCSNIQAKITAKHEEILDNLKKPLLSEAEKDREDAKRLQEEEDKKWRKEKTKEYLEYFEHNAELFTNDEKAELLKLLQAGSLIKAGYIIEAKMQADTLL